MGRRWWIASGVLLGALALISFVLTRASDATVSETSTLFTGVAYGPGVWGPGAAAVGGALLVVAGLLVAAAAVAYAVGRRQGSAGTAATPAGTDVEPDAEPSEQSTEPSERPADRGSWALPAALSLALALVAGGLVLVVTDPSSGYTLTTAGQGITPLDNVAAIPFGPSDTTYGLVTVAGVVPEVAGLPYDVAVLSLAGAGFTAIDVRDRDGGGVPDGVAPDRIVDRVTPAPGTSQPNGTEVVLYLR